MDTAISCVKDIIKECVGDVLVDLWREYVPDVKMLIFLSRAVTDMDEKVQRLQRSRVDINTDLARKDWKAKETVKKWLDEAGSAIERAESIRNEYQQDKYSRYRISIEIRYCQKEVEKLLSFLPPNGEYGVPAVHNQVPIQIPTFVGNGIHDAQSKIERLLTCKDTKTQVIGVYGSGGVGKTSLLQTINNSPKVKESFGLIIWLTVSKASNILNLQNCIAKRLDLELPEASDLVLRQHKLYLSLKDKKYILILDDMWESLDLQSLGVSLDGTASKIVLSTRREDVCIQMKAKRRIKVEPLSLEEGWRLFCKEAFEDGNVPQEIGEDVARKVAGKCQGLPLAIKVVAASMVQYTSRHKWEAALEQMETLDLTFYDMHDDIDKRLFQSLKLSYDDLPTERLKICFLYFAAYPEDHVINCEEVIDILIAEGKVSRSQIEAGHSLIDSLESRCLIEVVHRDAFGRIEQVKIHDVLRDMAILIAAKEQRCYFKTGQGESRFPEEEDYKKGCVRMSLINNHLQSLPTAFACSSLSVLLLRENEDIKEIPVSFLRELSSLRILDLSYTGITYLPDCIGNLKQLASLQLKSTGICKLPETVGDLKELQFLNLSCCEELQCLPERISELKRLRALNIEGCASMSCLPRGISKLVSLEILRTEYCIEWDFEDANAERKHACLKDLQRLDRLRVFSGQMRSKLKEGVMGNWSKMRNLTLICQNQDGLPRDDLPQDMRKMKDLERLRLWHVGRLPSWLSEFRQLEMLHIAHCKQWKELPAELGELPSLKVLNMADCIKLEKLELGMGFRKLEALWLWKMYGLELLECAARAEAAASGSGGSPLPMLKSLTVRQCWNLKTLLGEWDKLKCLQRIEGSREWWDAIQWDNPTIGTSLETKLFVTNP